MPTVTQHGSGRMLTLTQAVCLQNHRFHKHGLCPEQPASPLSRPTDRPASPAADHMGPQLMKGAGEACPRDTA